MSHIDDDASPKSPASQLPASVLAAATLLGPPDARADEDGVFARTLPAKGNYFTDAERRVLDAVLLRLFPDDGNGPGAQDLNALAYLEWAMTDPSNLDDGDPQFIRSGIGPVERMAREAHGVAFAELAAADQQAILERRARTKRGQNWLSLLMYYLTEALLLDPCYGANPDMIGWLWLDHRPGFPRPVPGKTCRDFE